MGRWSNLQRVENEKKILTLQAENPSISYTEIEEITGISRQTVRQIFRRHQLPESQRGNYRDKRYAYALQPYQEELLITRYHDGCKLDEIQQDFDISRDTVYAILRRHGISTRGMGRGSDHPCWNGGRNVDQDGYIQIWLDDDHPLVSMRKQDGYVFEHRLVMAEYLGRPLTKYETVHHKNGIRDDNRLDNLQLRQGNHGRGVIRRCRACGSCDIVEEEL